ncbi:MAG: phosphate ABC transporter permease PstA [Rhizobiaceae bacterium]
MTDTTRTSNAGHVAKRYASERRFRFAGVFALLVTTLFLAFLLFDIVGRSLPAFYQHYAVLNVMVDPAKVDAAKPETGDFEGLTKAAWRAEFPGVDSRADRKLLNSLMSNGAGQELRERVVADPSLIGKEVEISAIMSDDADLYYKGMTTGVARAEGKTALTIGQDGDKFFLSGAELAPGQIVMVNGGAFKVAKEGISAPAEVIVPPTAITQAEAGKWQTLTFDTPEENRKTGDREAVWMEMFRDKGKVETSIAWNFFVNGDSREAELAGIAGSIMGSLMVVFITIMIALPIGVGAAIYLEEFAPKNTFTDIIEVNINNLAAVPSIIFGLLGLAVFLGFFGMSRSLPLVGGLVIALMSLPTIIIASRAAVRAVPPSIREAALGMGASKQQAVAHHVLPLAMPGIMTGTILAVASAIGETAPLLLIGMVAFIVDIPTGFLDTATVLPVQIYLWSDLPEKAFEARTAAAIVVLLVIMLILNAFAIFLRKKFERRW